MSNESNPSFKIAELVFLCVLDVSSQIAVISFYSEYNIAVGAHAVIEIVLFICHHI
jgi:hypothetical protein